MESSRFKKEDPPTVARRGEEKNQQENEGLLPLERPHSEAASTQLVVLPVVPPSDQIALAVTTPNDDRYHEEKENNHYAQLAKACAMDALAITWGTLVWIWVYFFIIYAELIEKSGNTLNEERSVAGYIIGCVLEGALSNLSAYWLVKKGLIYDGHTEEEAAAETRRYFWKYLPIDSSYQAMEGLVVMLGGEGWQFDLVDDAVYNAKEMCAGLGVFLIGDALLYMTMCRLFGEKITAREAFTIGAQYFVFYSTDYFVNYDLEMGSTFADFLWALLKKTPELSLGAAAVGGSAFAMNFLQKAFILSREQQAQVVDATMLPAVVVQHTQLPATGVATNQHTLFAAGNVAAGSAQVGSAISTPAHFLFKHHPKVNYTLPAWPSSGPRRKGYAQIEQVPGEEEAKLQTQPEVSQQKASKIVAIVILVYYSKPALVS